MYPSLFLLIYLFIRFLDHQWTCQHCQKSFQYSRALSVHTAFGCEELGSSTNTHDSVDYPTADVAANDGLAGPDAVEIFTDKCLSGHSEAIDDELEDVGVDSKESIIQRPRLSSPDHIVRKINEQSSVTFGHSHIMSNPRLASLISSFSPPRFRKFTRESQSLAEYHKQEFRKKFQGNEHYLQRHLYRENMERKGSLKYRRTLVMKDDRKCSSQGEQDEHQIKEEKEEFINCFRDDYTLGCSAFSSSATHEIFRRSKIINASTYNSQADNFPANGYLTLSANETLRVAEEGSSRESARECTCSDHQSEADVPKQRQSIIANEEINVAENSAAKENEERTLDSSRQLSDLESQTNLNRLDSYYVFQGKQRDHVTYRQHLQCHCFSTPSLYAPNDNITRYHEPAFLVSPMYRYSPYPHMLPFFAHHTTNSSQASLRTQGFRCEYCGKVYCRKYVLKIHMRTHTGFKPLRCKVCDKSFSDPSNMKKHVKLHETEDTVHKCRHCGRNFVRYRGLLNHIKSKHSEHVPIENRP